MFHPIWTSYDLLQDTAGFIWSSGPEGLMRFDGSRTKVHSLISQGLAEMGHIKGMQDAKGRLWFLSYAGMLSCYENGSFHVFEGSDSIKHLISRNKCASFHYDSLDVLHLGVKGTGYYQYHPQGNLVSVVTQETHGNGVYVGRKGGKPFVFSVLSSSDTLNPLPIYRFEETKGGLEFQLVGHFPSTADILYMQARLDIRASSRANGNVLFTANNFLFEVQQDTVLIHNTGVQMTGILEDDHGGLWLSNAAKGGVLYFPEGKYDLTNVQELLPHVHVHSIAKDRYQGVWLGTDGDGLYHAAFPYMEVLDFPESYSNINTIFDLEDPVFYNGKEDNIFHAYDGKQAYTYRIERANGVVTSMYYDQAAKRLYVCAYDSLMVFTPQSIRSIAHPSFRFVLRRGHIKKRDSSLWIASGRSIMKWQNDTLVEALNQAPDEIRDFCWYQNELHIATPEGVFRYTKDTWLNLGETYEGLLGRCDHLRVYNDALWVFSFQKGCFVLSGDTIQELPGLLDYSVRAIGSSVLKDGSLLITGIARCIIKIVPDSSSAIGYQCTYIPSAHYEDPIVVAEMDAVGEQLVIESKGRLFLYYEDRLQKVPQIDLVLQEASFNGRKYARKTAYTVPHDSNNISISFKGLAFYGKGLKGYSYRIHAEQPWTATVEDKADFSLLPPGEYLFEVFAVNSHLQVSPTKSIRITVKPPFYATWWFQLLVVLGISFTIWWLFKWRIGQVRQRGHLIEELHSSQHQALAARMNPHFIFNSLSAIHQYTLSNNKEEAAEYMSEYAQLMRLVMDNAGRALVELQSELEAMNIYLGLEQLRSKGKIKCEVHIDSKLDTGETLIPALLIWPYLENAIWHGLMPKKEEPALLIIRFQTSSSSGVCVEIEDNGIGRSQAAAMGTGNHPGFKSEGMNMTQERLDLIGKIYKVKIAVSIIDLQDHQGKASGTLVRLDIPSFE